MNPDTRRLPPRTIYLVIAMIIGLVLCLSLTVCLAASPRPPHLAGPPVTVSEEAAQSGENKIMAVADAPLGPFSVELTQEEATSLMALRLPGSPFLNPQVVFTTGYIHISGIVNMGMALRVDSLWTVVNDGGEPQVHLERASIGPFAMPPVLLNSISSTINDMIAESGTGILPTAVTIEEGRIIVYGSKSPPTIP